MNDAPLIIDVTGINKHFGDKHVVKDLSMTVAYVGSSSNYLLGQYNWNGSEPGPPATEPQRRRIPRWNNISLVSPYGASNYHGLDVQVDKRYSRGLSFTAAYTWSHAIDNMPEQFGGGGGGLMDLRNIDLNRGNANFDVRQRFVTSVAWAYGLADKVTAWWAGRLARRSPARRGSRAARRR